MSQSHTEGLNGGSAPFPGSVKSMVSSVFSGPVGAEPPFLEKKMFAPPPTPNY